MRIIGWALIILFSWKIVTRHIEKTERRNFNNGLEQVLYILDTCGIKNSNVVYCQMYLETAKFKSKIYRENHNIFGMKESSRNFDIGAKHGHANYPTLIESIKDYAAWQKQMDWKGGSDEDYIYFLGHLPGNRRYAEDLKYEKKIRHFLKIIYDVRR